MKTNYQEGQIWSYKTREKEKGSNVIILKVENIRGKDIIHIAVKGVQIKISEDNVLDFISHLPFSVEAVEKSTLELIEENTELPDFSNGYEQWKKEFEKGRAGFFTISIKEAVDVIETTVLKGKRIED